MYGVELQDGAVYGARGREEDEGGQSPRQSGAHGERDGVDGLCWVLELLAEQICHPRYAPARLIEAGAAPTDPSPLRRAGLADSLRNELQLYGISVHLFLPATIFSPGFENEQKLKPEICKKIEGPDEGMTPEQVAAHMIRGEPGRARSHRLAHCSLSALHAGLERNDYYITYEPVGHMLRNSRGITPRNNVLKDTFWGIAGTVRRLSFTVEPSTELILSTSRRSPCRFGGCSRRTEKSEKKASGWPRSSWKRSNTRVSHLL